MFLIANSCLAESSCKESEITETTPTILANICRIFVFFVMTTYVNIVRTFSYSHRVAGASGTN